MSTEEVEASESQTDEELTRLDNEENMLVQYKNQGTELVALTKQTEGDPSNKQLQEQLAVLTKKQHVLRTTMIESGVPLPTAPISEVLASIRQWQELYNSMYMTLRASEICFDILKHQPLIDEIYAVKELPQLEGLQTPQTVDSAQPSKMPIITGSGTKDEVARTWTELRSCIRDVIRVSMPNLQSLYHTMGKVSVLANNYKTFTEAIPSPSNAQSAYKFLHLIEKPCVDLMDAAATIQAESDKFFELMVDKAGTMLNQVGQENLRANATTVSNNMLLRKQMVQDLRGIYEEELKASNELAKLQGELTATREKLKYAKGNTIWIQAFIDQITDEAKQLEENRDNEAKDLAAKLKNSVETYDEVCTKMLAQAQAEQAVARQKAAEQQQLMQNEINEYTTKLKNLPAEVLHEKKVELKHLFGAFSTVHSVAENISNPEVDVVKNKMEILQQQRARESEQAKRNIDNIAASLENLKKLNATTSANTDQLQKLQKNAQELYKNHTEALEVRRKGWETRLVSEQQTIALLTSDITRLEAQEITQQSNLTANKLLIAERAAKKHEEIATCDKTIEQAQKNTQAIVNHYGGVNSRASVVSIMELLGFLLALPKAINTGKNNFNQFREKVLQLVENVQEGVLLIKEGSSVMAPFETTPDGVASWLRSNNNPKEVIDAMQSSGIDYDTLISLSKDELVEFLKEAIPTMKPGTVTITANRLLKQVKEFHAEKTNKTQTDAVTSVKQGMERVQEQVQFFTAFSDATGGDVKKAIEAGKNDS